MYVQCMKRPGERNHREAAEADRSSRGGREATGPVEEEGPRTTPLLAIGVQTQSPHQKQRHLNVGPSPTSEQTGRPKDDETHPEDGLEKRSHEPNSRNSFARDQVGRT